MPRVTSTCENNSWSDGVLEHWKSSTTQLQHSKEGITIISLPGGSKLEPSPTSCSETARFWVLMPSGVTSVISLAMLNSA